MGNSMYQAATARGNRNPSGTISDRDLFDSNNIGPFERRTTQIYEWAT